VECRSVERNEVVASVECEVRGRSQRAIVFDLSTNGCLVQCSPMFADVGDAFRMSFPGGLSLQGKVRWRKGFSTGVQFAGSFPQSVIQQFALPDFPSPRAWVRSPAHSSRSPESTPVRGLVRPFDPPSGMEPRHHHSNRVD
jgi:hypothetical protein